jgi:predicted TIM-barrel fold metal-dependent hydrolase
LRRATERYPDVKVAIEHIWGLKVGAPPYPLLDNLFAYAKDANIYVKFAINNILAAREGGGSARPLIEKLVKEFGANRLMWCSNYPAHPKIGGYKARLETAQQEFAFLGADERAWLFEKTARSVHPDLPA